MVIFHSYVNVYQRVRTMCFHVLLNIVALRLRFRVPLPRSHLPPREVGDDYSKLSLGEHGESEGFMSKGTWLLSVEKTFSRRSCINYAVPVKTMLFHAVPLMLSPLFIEVVKKVPGFHVSLVFIFFIIFQQVSMDCSITYFCHRPAMWLQEDYQWWVPALAL
jgi:hypothetical protein